MPRRLGCDTLKMEGVRVAVMAVRSTGCCCGGCGGDCGEIYWLWLWWLWW